MKVERIMTSDPGTIRHNDSCHTAARIMWDRDCGCVPVVDDTMKVVGMLTDRDICMAALLQDKPLRDVSASIAMSKQVCSVKPGDSIELAEKTMQNNKVRRLPVVDTQNRVVGVLSINDIVREATRERQQQQKEVQDSEVARTLSAVCEPRLTVKSPVPHIPMIS